MSAGTSMVLSPLGVFRVTLKAMQVMRLAGRAPRTAGRAARAAKVDVEIQNHALFDSTPERAARLKARKAGEPNPFLMTTDRYVKLWDIASECIQAEIAKR